MSIKIASSFDTSAEVCAVWRRKGQKKQARRAPVASCCRKASTWDRRNAFWTRTAAGLSRPVRRSSRRLSRAGPPSGAVRPFRPRPVWKRKNLAPRKSQMLSALRSAKVQECFRRVDNPVVGTRVFAYNHRGRCFYPWCSGRLRYFDSLTYASEQGAASFSKVL